MVNRIHAIALFVLCLGTSATAGVPDITVCPSGCDYSSLNDALDSLAAGDDVVIHVYAGAYDDAPFNVAGSSGATVRIIGVDGAENTILSSAGTGRVVDVGNGDFMRLEGLTIADGDPGGNSDQGAGVKVASGGQLELIDCIVRDNETDNHGAGVYVEDGAAAIIEGCLFQNNHIIENGTISLHGGGVHIESIDGSTIDRCRFISNSATGYGGGLFQGRENQDAGVVDYFPQVRNCLFVDNVAGFNGGGAYVEPALLGCKEPVVIGYVTNCTFIGNSSPRAGAIWGNNKLWCGASLGLDSPSCIVLNSILWKNGPDWPSENRPAIFNRCAIDFLSAEDAAVFECTNLNPRFYDESGPDGIPWNADGDYRMLPGSVCIDSGASEYLGGSIEFGSYDVSGLARVFDDPHSANIGNPPVDLGAYEVDGEDVPIDLAYWTGGGNTPQLLDPSNWFKEVVPSPERGWIFDDSAGVILQSDASLSLVALFSGSLAFSPGSTGSITLGDKSGLESIYMGVMGEAANLKLSPGLEINCESVENWRGRLYLDGATISAETSVHMMQSDQLANSAGANGIKIGTLHGPGTIRRINDNSQPGDPLDPVLINNGRIRVDGRIEVHGDFKQDGGILRLEHRTHGGLGPNRRIDVDGMASVGGSVVFDVQVAGWDPPVGASFEILNATEGFEAGHDSFDFAVTQWYGDPRFFICSTVENVGGAGSSIVATVATIESLVSADPALEDIGIVLQDMLLVDVDGDGAEDLVLSVDAGEDSNGQVVVLLNSGTDSEGVWSGFESFASAYSITVEEGPRGLDAGFIDAGSAQPGANYDLLVANENSGTVSVIQNNSSIGSVDLSIIQTVQIGGSPENLFPTDVCALNLDGDAQGYSDMLVACATGVVWTYRNVTAFHGFGGMDSPEESKPDEPIDEFEPGLGGGGGVRDTGPAGRSRAGSTMEIGRVESLLGPGGIQVSWQSYGLPPGSEPSDIGVGDLDQNGFDDVVTSNENDASISIMLGSGVGAFHEPITIPLDLGYLETESIDTGDVDGDGDLDIVLVCLGPEEDPLLGQQRVLRTVRNTLVQGAFGWVFDVEEGLRGLEPYLVRTADVDADGIDDVIALTETSLGFNGPSFGMATMVIPPEIETCLGDINGDGQVNGADMGLLLAGWGPCTVCQGDFNDDGAVNGADLGLLLGAWGLCQGADGGS
ncbi:MAG: FG-GAP-like repeat-containing protein [Phycisphaerales bacterium]|nr:FG-GAP-like repeat-containing protein [Phycisphaerales bacterium]